MDSKNFLLPHILFPLSPLSPGGGSNSARDLHHQLKRPHQNQVLTFNYVSSSEEKSELEATLDFHVHHWNSSLDKEDKRPEIGRNYLKINQDKISHEDFAGLFISILLVEIPDLFLPQCSNWFNNQIIQQTLTGLLQAPIENAIETAKTNFSLNFILDFIANSLEGQSNELKNLKINPDDQLWAGIVCLLGLSGLRVQEVKEKVSFFTSKKCINEAFLIDVCFAFMARLLIGQNSSEQMNI